MDGQKRIQHISTDKTDIPNRQTGQNIGKTQPKARGCIQYLRVLVNKSCSISLWCVQLYRGRVVQWEAVTLHNTTRPALVSQLSKSKQ